MPPDTQALTRLLEQGEIELTKGEQHILGMYSTDGLGFALQETEWDVQEEINKLIGIIRSKTAAYPDVLAAIRLLNTRVREIAELNGLIVKGSYHATRPNADGSREEVVASTSRLVNTLRGARPGTGRQLFGGTTREPIEPSEADTPAGDDAAPAPEVDSS